MAKTYTNEELNALVAEFSAEFDALVKAEVAKTGTVLAKADDESPSDDKKDKAPPSDSSGSDSSAGGPPPAAESAPAAPAPDASASSAPASAPSADPAAASASPAAPAGGDPMAALSQAYAQLSPEELQMHFEAMKQVLMTQQASAGAAPAAPMADPMAGAAGAAPAAPVAPAPDASAAPAGGVAPLAGEGSKPLDPAATMALKSEHEKQMNLVKSERDALESKVEQLTETLGKVLNQPIRKSVTGKDLIGMLDSEKPAAPSFDDMSKAEITKKLLTVARNPELKKADRELINKYYKGTANVDALAHLLS